MNTSAALLRVCDGRALIASHISARTNLHVDAKRTASLVLGNFLVIRVTISGVSVVSMA